MGNEPGKFLLRAESSNTGTVYRWELMTDLGQTIASSCDFPSKETAEKAVAWLKANVAGCPVELITGGPSVG